jgi:mevalonate kinase
LKKRFYSNGKLLITGEYLVLDGAKAFALPTKMGQDLIILEIDEINTIRWKSIDFDQSIWFAAVFNSTEIITKSFVADENSIAKVLKNILYEAHQLNQTILPEKGFSIETNLTFPRFWGLGTSSTLLNNVAQWFEIDAFDLLKNSFGGSGYDIANAQNNTPIIYQLADGTPTVEPINFAPHFTANMYFLYLNEKQNSKDAIATYYSKQQNIRKAKLEIDAISNELILTKEQGRFEHLLRRHESILSDILEMQTVQDRFFSDFTGTIKSLGAWGGDFVLVVSNSNPKEYFEAKGFKTLLPYHKMIL